ncbi:MAG: complex I NDUFA9 subunit family protein [Betaproteobacteria bacterium]|nr:complex I NDUFA9 subunit family protein [Betaproteobacteria bacterium]
MSAPRIVVFGGGGFLGSRLVTALADLGYRVIVPTRRRDHVRHLLVLPSIEVLETPDLDDAQLERLLEGAIAVYFLVGILHERRPGDSERVHVTLLGRVLAAARRAQVGRLLHVSALRADAEGPSEYLRSKAQGEALVRGSGLAWTIFQPSVMFGPGDRFLGLFAKLLKWTLVVPLAAAETRFQPIYVADVATCLARALHDGRTLGQTYPLCGPKIYSLREIVRYVAELSGGRRWIIGLGASLGAIQAAIFELLPGSLLTRDNLRSMQRDNVCECAFPAVFAVEPASLESIAPTYLGPGAVTDPYFATREKRLR